MTRKSLQKYTCDRCGFDYRKDQLRRQRGMLLYHDCIDNLKRIKQPNPRWMSPRDDSDSTDPVNTPTVYTISAATGITTLSQSREYTHEGSRRNFNMQVVSDGGAIDITADPQIVAGLQGDVLTLTGTSNTNTILLEDDGTLHLLNSAPFTLTEGDNITLVYNVSGLDDSYGWGEDLWGEGPWGDADIGWVECSRNKGGI